MRKGLSHKKGVSEQNERCYVVAQELDYWEPVECVERATALLLLLLITQLESKPFIARFDPYIFV